MGKIMDEEHFFGEWVEYHDEEEKIRALRYLEDWKFFLLRKIPQLKFIEEIIIEKPKIPLSLEMNTIGIKIKTKGKKPDFVI